MPIPPRAQSKQQQMGGAAPRGTGRALGPGGASRVLAGEEARKAAENARLAEANKNDAALRASNARVRKLVEQEQREAEMKGRVPAAAERGTNVSRAVAESGRPGILRRVFNFFLGGTETFDVKAKREEATQNLARANEARREQELIVRENREALRLKIQELQKNHKSREEILANKDVRSLSSQLKNSQRILNSLSTLVPIEAQRELPLLTIETQNEQIKSMRTIAEHAPAKADLAALRAKGENTTALLRRSLLKAKGTLLEQERLKGATDAQINKINRSLDQAIMNAQPSSVPPEILKLIEDLPSTREAIPPAKVTVPKVTVPTKPTGAVRKRVLV